MSPRSRQIGWVIVGLLLGIVATQLVVNITRTNTTVRLTNETVTLIRQSQESNGETLRTVKSCTTPGRPCYERSQRQTARAIASINKITILAAACAAQDGPRSVAVIEECVLDQLGRGH